MYSMDVKNYPALNIFFKGKVLCPDFNLFLSGLYERVLRYRTRVGNNTGNQSGNADNF